MNTEQKCALALIALLFVSGCVGISNNPENGRSAQGSVDLDISTVSNTSSYVHLNGSVHYTEPAGTQPTFNNVMVCAYGETQLLNGKSIGTISATKSHQSFEINVSSRPHYIVIHHPGFATNHERKVLRLNENNGGRYTYVTKVDVPYPANGTAGACPAYGG